MPKTFRTLDDVDVKGKRVLLRVDLNVPMENGRVTDATRLERVAPTITEIATKGGKVILLAHFGRPKGRDAKEINEAMKRAAEQQLKGILGYTTAPNVSIDFNHDPHSSTFHMDQTKVINGNLVRVMSWYDNEWGFSNRMADTAVAMGKLL